MENETTTTNGKRTRTTRSAAQLPLADDRALEALARIEAQNEKLLASSERTVQLLEAIEKHSRTSTGVLIKAEQRLAQLVEIEHVALQLQLGEDDDTKKNPRG